MNPNGEREDERIMRRMVREAGLAIPVVPGYWTASGGTSIYRPACALPYSEVTRGVSISLGTGGRYAIGRARVEWSSFQAASLGATEAFAYHLLAASAAARAWNEARNRYQEEFRQAVEAIEAEGPEQEASA